MATAPSQAAQEAGAGGKFRKRPFQRTPSTPYDRQPSAARAAASSAARNQGSGAAGNGWRSKIMDPVSRIVARSASKFFESVFRKRLTAPPDVSENKLIQRQEVLDGLCNKSLSGVQEQNCNKGINPINGHGSHLPCHASDSTIDGTSELEQLLKQNRFTRAEFDRLMELLRSRTVESSSSKDLNPERKENMDIFIEANKEKQPVIEQNILQSARMHGIKTTGNLTEVEARSSVLLHGSNASPSVGLILRKQVLEGEAASPTEIAKAYMGSRSSKGFPTSLGIRYSNFEEDRALCNSMDTEKLLDLSVAPNSPVSLAATSRLTKSSHISGRPHGRSSIYKMSRSPILKAQRTSNDGRSLLGHHIESSTSRELALMNIMQSYGKQAKKRGSSVLDDDIGPLVPARRVRHKSYIMPTSRYMSSIPHHSTPSTSSLGKDAHRYHRPLKQKLGLDERGHRVLESIGSGEDGVPSMGFLPIPPQSSEMARKILEQLDKLMPSPKESSPKLEVTHKYESPSKLTVSMLHGRALKSMEDIDSSRFLRTDGADDLVGSSDMHRQSLRSSILQKHDIAKKDSPSNLSESGFKETTYAFSFEKPVVCAADGKSSMESAAIAALDVRTSEQKPAFRISAPDDFLEFDDGDDEGDYDVKEPPKADVVLHEKAKLVEDEIKMHKPGESSSGGVPVATLKLQNSEKTFEIPTTERDNGFLLSASPTLNSSLPSPSQLCVPTTIFKGLDSENEKIADSSFKFSSKEAYKIAPSSTTFAFSDSLVKLDGSSTVPKIHSDGIMDTGVKSHKCVGLASTFSGSAFSSSTSSDLNTFGAANIFSPTSILATTLSSGSSVSIFPASSSSTASTSVFSAIPAPAISYTTSPILSASATFAVSSFNGGTGHSLSGFTTAASSNSNYVSSNAEEGSIKMPSFGISSVPPSSLAAISSTGGNNSEFTNSAVISTINYSASSPKLVLFSGTDTVSSAQQISSKFPSTANGVFSFGASPNSGDKVISSPSSTSQSSLTSVGNTVGGTESGSCPANSSMMFGLSSSSSSASSTSLFGSSSLSTQSLGPASLYSFSATPGVSPIVSGSSSSFASTEASGSSSGFSFSASAVSSSGFGSSNFVVPTFGSSSFTSVAISSSTSGSNTSFAENASSPHINQNSQTSSSIFSAISSFSSSIVGVSSSISGSSTLFAASASSPQFNPSFQTSPLPPVGSFVSTSSPSTGFAFASSTSSSGSSLFTFGASSASFSGNSHFAFGASAPTNPFKSPGSTTSNMTSAQPVFGMTNQLSGMNSVSPGNDQMNVEDSMADGPVQSSFNLVPAFGQPTTAPATPIAFGSSNVTGGSSVFQFGNTQSNSFSPNPSPFQPAGSLDFSAGGSFSLGSGGDKSGRRIVKVRRDKSRKK